MSLTVKHYVIKIHTTVWSKKISSS